MTSHRSEERHLALSVAMCTYNGERFLGEQLASIAAQTRLPDQLVICDDRSNDTTQGMIGRFADEAQFPVEVHTNKYNLGSTRNFDRAIRRCRGDVIVLTDQDDIWSTTRLEHVEAVFANDCSVSVAFSNATVIDADSRPVPLMLWDSVGFTSSMQSQVRHGRAAHVLLKHNVMTGATMAFRACFRKQILPIPPIWIHDGWIALIISALGRAAMLTDNAISYRKHAAQQIGPPDISIRDAIKAAQQTAPTDYLNMAEQYRLVLERVRQHAVGGQRAILSQVERKIEHLRWRSRIPQLTVGRLPNVLWRCLNSDYFRYSDGWKSIAKDLFF